MACLHRLKHSFHRRETATESLSYRKTSIHLMWEFITESGMIKNIFFTVMSIWRKRLLITAKSIWQLNSMFHRLKHFFPSTWDCNREFELQENLYSLHVRIHHRICDYQKHLLHTLVKLKEKTIENWKKKSGCSMACFHCLKHFFHRRETGTDSLSCRKTSIH